MAKRVKKITSFDLLFGKLEATGTGLFQGVKELEATLQLPVDKVKLSDLEVRKFGELYHSLKQSGNYEALGELIVNIADLSPSAYPGILAEARRLAAPKKRARTTTTVRHSAFAH